MNEESTPLLTPLDQMVSDDSLQMLKAAVPYLPSNAQLIFAMYAKIKELSHTITAFSGAPAEIRMMSEQPKASQPLDVLQNLRQYAGEPQKATIDQILFAFHALEILQMPQESVDT